MVCKTKYIKKNILKVYFFLNTLGITIMRNRSVTKIKELKKQLKELIKENETLKFQLKKRPKRNQVHFKFY